VRMRSLAYGLSIAFVFAVPWQSGVNLHGLGTLSKALGFACAGVWLLSVVGRGRIRPLDRFQKWYFLFLVWNGLTLYWSINTGATAAGFLTYLQLFIMLVVVWDLFDTERKIESALQAFVFGAYVAALSVIVEYGTHPAAKFPTHERLKGIGNEVDGIALVMAIGIPAALYLAASPAGRRRMPGLRVVNYAYLPIALFGMVLTGTRGAMLASLPTAAFVIWSLRRASPLHRVMAAGALVAVAFVVIGFAPQGQLSRIETATTVGDLGSSGGALNGRWGIWLESLQAFEQRPIFGSGLDTHRDTVAVGKKAHNTYISVLVETGIVGFVLFSAVLFSVFTRIARRTGWDAWYWFTQVGVLAIGAMSLSLEHQKGVWIFLSFAVASAANAEGNQEVSVAERAEAEPTRLRPVGLSPTYISTIR
jgi:hypothetical protein